MDNSDLNGFNIQTIVNYQCAYSAWCDCRQPITDADKPDYAGIHQVAFIPIYKLNAALKQ